MNCSLVFPVHNFLKILEAYKDLPIMPSGKITEALSFKLFNSIVEAMIDSEEALNKVKEFLAIQIQIIKTESIAADSMLVIHIHEHLQTDKSTTLSFKLITRGDPLDKMIMH